MRNLPALGWLLLRTLPTLGRSRAVARSGPVCAIQHWRSPAPAAEHLAAFSRHFGSSSPMLSSYLYLLAHRAQLASLLHPAVPVRLPGLVQVGNEIWSETPLLPDNPVEQTVATIFEVKDQSVRLRLDVQLTQNDLVVGRVRSTYSVTRAARPRIPTEVRQWKEIENWNLPAGTGWQYARLSGDYNPIHLHPWLSRWFGFARPIAHGMYLTARAEARLCPNASLLTVKFRRPVFLPAKVEFCRFDSGFAVTSEAGQVLHLEGQFTSRK